MPTKFIWLILLCVVVSMIVISATFFKKQTKSAYLFIKNRYFSTEEAELDNSRRLANTYFYLSVIFGLLFIFLNPPFACPDEVAHFINICRVSHGDLFAVVENGQVGCYLTQNEINFIQEYNGLYNLLTEHKFSYNHIYEFNKLLEPSSLEFFTAECVTINPTPYIVPGALVGIVRSIVPGIHPYQLLIFAKLPVLFFTSLIIRLAILKTPVMKNTMFALALMPMTIYQTSSVSYDAITIAVCFLLFAYGTKIILSDDNYIITKGDIIAVCLSFALICGSKVAYAPLIFILATVSIKKFGCLKKYFICIGVIAALGIIFYLIPTVVNNVITSDVTFTDADKIAAQREYFFNNIWKTPIIVVATTKDLIGYWIISFFGILGSLDAFFPAPLMVLYLFFLLAVAVTDLCTVKNLKIKTRLVSFLSVLLIVTLSIIVMYIEWTPRVLEDPKGNVSYGMQGRYFIPTALFSLIPLGNTFLSKFKYKNNLIAIEESAAKIICTGFLVLTSALLLVRFWI